MIFKTDLEDSIRQFCIRLFDFSSYCFVPSQDISLFSSKTSDDFPSKFSWLAFKYVAEKEFQAVNIQFLFSHNRYRNLD